MAKANNNSITKDNPAIKRKAAELRAAIPAWERADKKRHATYKAAEKDIRAVGEKYERYLHPFKGFPRNMMSPRDADLKRVYRKHGYDRAVKNDTRLTGEVIALCKYISRLKPKSIRDFGEQAFAFNLLDMIFGRDFNGPIEDSFQYHVAKLAGVSLHNGGVRQ